VLDSFAGARRLAEAGAGRGARLDVALVLARRLDVEGRLQGRLRPPQAGRHHRRPPGREARFLAPFPTATLPGVGPRAEQRLARRGIETIGELAALSDAELARVLPGQVGPLLRDRARGIDPRDLELDASAISISTEETFERDLIDRRRSTPSSGAWRTTSRHLAADGLSARTVTTKLRYYRLLDPLAARRRCRRRSTSPSGSASSRAAPRPRPARPAGRAAAGRRRRLRADGAPPARRSTSCGAAVRRAQQRPRQARRPAVALPRDLVARVGDDVDAGALHPAARLVVALERERARGAEREDVRALRLELLVRHLDDPIPRSASSHISRVRGDARVDEREVAVERRDEATSGASPRGAVPVRQVERDHLARGERLARRAIRPRVRAVADADEQRPSSSQTVSRPRRSRAARRGPRRGPRRLEHATVASGSRRRPSLPGRSSTRRRADEVGS
jgi:hypothetical protein